MAKSKNNNRKNVVATTLNRLIVIFKRTAMVALSALGNFLYTTIKDGKVLFNLIVLEIVLISIMYFLPMPLLVFAAFQYIVGYLAIAIASIYIGVFIYNDIKNRMNDISRNPLQFLSDLVKGIFRSIFDAGLTYKLIVIELLLVASIILLPLSIPVPLIIQLVMQQAAVIGLALIVVMLTVQKTVGATKKLSQSFFGDFVDTSRDIVHSISRGIRSASPLKMLTFTQPETNSISHIYSSDDFKIPSGDVQSNIAQKIRGGIARLFNLSGLEDNTLSIISTIVDNIIPRSMSIVEHNNVLIGWGLIGLSIHLPSKAEILNTPDDLLLSDYRLLGTGYTKTFNTSDQTASSTYSLIGFGITFTSHSDESAITNPHPIKNFRGFNFSLPILNARTELSLANNLYHHLNKTVTEITDHHADANEKLPLEIDEDDTFNLAKQSVILQAVFNTFSLHQAEQVQILRSILVNTNACATIENLKIIMPEEFHQLLTSTIETYPESREESRELISSDDEPIPYNPEPHEHEQLPDDNPGYPAPYTSHQINQNSMLNHKTTIMRHYPLTFYRDVHFTVQELIQTHLKELYKTPSSIHGFLSGYNSYLLSAEFAAKTILSKLQNSPLIESKNKCDFTMYEPLIINSHLEKLASYDEDIVFSQRGMDIERGNIIEALAEQKSLSSNDFHDDRSWKFCKQLKLSTALYTIEEEISELKNIINSGGNLEQSKFIRDFMQLESVFEQEEFSRLDNEDHREVYLQHISFNRELALMALPNHLLPIKDKQNWLKWWYEQKAVNPEAEMIENGQNVKMQEPLMEIMNAINSLSINQIP